VYKYHFFLLFFSRRFILSYIIFLTFGFVTSQTVSIPILNTQEELHFDEIKFSNGASVTDVITYVEDINGFMWFGSRNGLMRYDGHDFKIFTHDRKNKNSLVSNYIWSLSIYNDTLLYIGCAQGLSILNLKTYRFTSYSSENGSCPTDYIHCFYFENDKTIWIGGRKGLFCYNSITGTFTDLKFSPPPYTKVIISNPNQVFAIIKHPYKNNILLLASEAGLIGYNKNQRKIEQIFSNSQIESQNPYKPFSINNLKLDEEKVWCMSWFMGMHCFDLKTEKWQNYFTHYYPNGIALGLTSLIIKNKNELWVTDRLDGNNNGLGVFNKITGKLNFLKNVYESKTNRLPNKAVYLFMQRDNTLWLSYMDGKGLYKQNKKINRFKSLKIPFKHLWISAFYYDSENRNYYFGFSVFSEGIGCWNSKTKKWQLIKPERNMVESVQGNSSDFSVNKIYKDEKGIIWIATAFNGLCYLDIKQNKIKQFLLPNKKTLPVRSPIFGLFEDSKEQLWVGTRTEGVFCINRERTRYIHYFHDEKDSMSISSGNSFVSFEEDKYGKIWMGNRNGFCVFNPKTQKFSRTIFQKLKEQGINSGLTQSILKDTLNRIWVTILDQGLIRITEKEENKIDYKIFQTESGLKNLAINYMTKDKNGCFWIVNDGILFFNPYDETYVIIDDNHGMLDNCSGDDKIMIDEYGNLFTGGQVGINWVKEVQNYSGINHVKLFIERLSINGNPIEWNSSETRKIKFKHIQNNITFNYTSVCFNETDQIRYRFKLLPIEKEWNQPTTLLEARYMQLKPGKYRFILEVSYKGRWLKESAFVNFEIQQVFWKTWWFLGILSLIFFGILFIIYRYRINQLIKIQSIRNKIASDLHDDVGSTLSSISIMSDILQTQLDDRSRSEQMIQKIGTNAHSMLDSMDDIIWSVNPSNDKFQNIALRIREYAIPLFEMKNIQFEIVTPQEMYAVTIPMEIRRNIYLIVKEGINNLLKYSECSNAKVEFSFQHSILSVMIFDNGIGFDVTKVKAHRNGLESIKNRASQIHGNITIASEIGKGTTISFTVKII